MIIDCHVHPKLYVDNEINNANEIEKLLDCMERVEIDKVCLTPIVQINNSNGYFAGKEHITYAAEFLTKTVKAYPDKFFSLIWLNPHLSMEYLTDLIKKYIIDGCINGVKLWTEMNASEEKIDQLAGFLEKYDIPVLYHTFYNSLGRSYFESSPPEIAGLARKHPGLRIVMAHLRMCRFRGVQDIKACPNVSIDTSGSGMEDCYLEYALKELGPDRILFGSDYSGRDFASQRARIDSLYLEPEIKEKLFSGNAIKFFRRQQR